MNTIKCEIRKSPYEIYDDYFSYKIDGYLLDDDILNRLYPNRLYKGLTPTLSMWLWIAEEKESIVVWERIIPQVGEKVICPILMCPDDNDFSCMLIVAEIENKGDIIYWNKIGLDQTDTKALYSVQISADGRKQYNYTPEKVGAKVEWFDQIDKMSFEASEYKKMLENFKEQFKLDIEQYMEGNIKRKVPFL